MFGVFRNILLFFIGILLAVLFVYRGGVLFVLGTLGYAVETTAADSPAARARLQEVPSSSDAIAATIPVAAAKNENPLAELSEEELIEALQTAISEGTLQSLRLIRDQSLKELPAYESQILPALRKTAIASLVQRMNDADWRDWSASVTNLGGSPSMARLYVDDVRNVHGELGSTLETAAFLLSGLYSHTAQGRPFDLEEYSNYLFQNAEQFLSFRKQKAIPARFQLSPALLKDPYFLTTLEQERCRFVGRYLDSNHRQLSVAYDLLRSLEPRLCGPETFQSVSAFLLYVATKTSPHLRESFLYRELENRVIENLSRSSKKVRRVMAQLYVVAAIDSLDTHDKIAAGKFLRESVALEPGLKVQKMLASALQLADREPGPAAEVPSFTRDSQAGARLAEEQPAQSYTADDVGDERTISPLFIGFVMLLCCSIPLGVVYFLKNVRRRSNDQFSEYDVPLPDSEVIGFTKPVEETGSEEMDDSDGKQWYKAVG